MYSSCVVALAAIAGVLSGCAGSPAAVAQASPEELKQYENDQLCAAYYHIGRPPIVKAEIERRGFIKPELWPVIDEKKVRIGMPEAAVYCAWGRPDDVNGRVSRYGTSNQMVYRGYKKSQYVYTRNGIVESISD